jgi:glutaredoxin
LKAWAESLGGINYPLLSDFWPHGRVSHRYGVLRTEGYSERAIFVIDRSGMICFAKIYDIDEQPENDEVLEILLDIDPSASRAVLQPESVEAQELPQGGIVMYCTFWCPDCRRARNWLQEHDLEFTEVNISENPTAAAQVRIWGGGFKISPTFDIDGEVILNFDKEKLLQVLKEKEYL